MYSSIPIVTIPKGNPQGQSELERPVECKSSVGSYGRN